MCLRYDLQMYESDIYILKTHTETKNYWFDFVGNLGVKP